MRVNTKTAKNKTENPCSNQIENVNMVRDDFINSADLDNPPLLDLEKFYQQTAEILTQMRPTYFFLLDFYYEKKIATGQDTIEAEILEKEGLINFGHKGFTFGEIAVLACQALGILEAIYLILKKKKTARRLLNVDGRQKFLTSSEIYNIYLDKFNQMKKELITLK